MKSRILKQAFGQQRTYTFLSHCSRQFALPEVQHNFGQVWAEGRCKGSQALGPYQATSQVQGQLGKVLWQRSSQAHKTVTSDTPSLTQSTTRKRDRERRVFQAGKLLLVVTYAKPNSRWLSPTGKECAIASTPPQI